MPKVLQTQGKSDILYSVRDGFLICPICRRNKRLLKISPETKAHGLIVYCRDCKNEIRVQRLSFFVAGKKRILW